MKSSDTYSCRACVETIKENDVVWVDTTTGKVSTEGYSYCQGCVPEGKKR